MPRKRSGLKPKGLIKEQIEGLLEVSPLNNRLEAAVFIYLRDQGLVPGGDQQKLVDQAQAMSAFLINYVHIDPDKE